MGQFIRSTGTKANNKTIILFLLYFIHLKFFIQIVLDIESLFLDIILYVVLLLCVDYKHIKYSFLVLIPLALVSILNSAARNFFLIFIIAYLFYKIPLKEILYHNLCAQILVFLCCTICLLSGITQSVMFQQTIMDMRVRYDYGMGNPNTFALFVYSFIINLYLYKGIYNKSYLLFIAVIAYIVGTYTGSRTFIMAVVVLLILTCFRGLIKKCFKLAKWVMYMLPVLIIVSLYILSIRFSEFPTIDILFSGRLSLYGAFLSSLSPKDIIIGTNLINEQTIDNSFLHIAFEGGIIPFFIFIYLYYNMLKVADEESYPIIVALFCSVFLVGLTESILSFTLILGNMIIWIIMYKAFIDKKLSLGY